MTVISKKADLVRLLKLLKEANDESERALQKKLTQELEQLSEEDEDEDEEEPKKKAEEKPEEDSSAEPEKKEEPKEEPEEEKPKALPGAERLASLSTEPPANVTSDDVIERLNFIRAGVSLSDADVQRRIAGYIAGLDSSAAQGIWTALDGLARIMLLGSDPAEIPVPQQQAPTKKTVTQPQPQQIASSQPQQIVAPVVVGEAVARQMKDVEIPLSSGRLVLWGSKEHVNDLENRISDLIRIRSYQQRGSQSKHTLSQAINSLKSELQSAKRILDKNTMSQELSQLDDESPFDLGE